MYTTAVLAASKDLAGFKQDRFVLGRDLLDYLEDLIPQVPDSSKIQSSIGLAWRHITERDRSVLMVAIDSLKGISGLFSQISPMARGFLEVLEFDLERTEKRMIDAKHHYSFYCCIGDIEALEAVLGDPTCHMSYREWRGNFYQDVYKLLKKVFHFYRYNPRKPKKQERIRGYRDKGSMSSESEKARRAANTETWNEYLQEVYDYCKLTGCSPQKALKLFNFLRE
jgi:hypothetical protein